MAVKQPKKRALSSTFVDLFGDVAQEARTPPAAFKIFNPGVVKTRKGEFLFDDQAAASVMSAYQEHGVDFTIDYDHHTLATSSGVRAISAGWFGLELRGGELWATNVKWTPQATAYLTNGEYRYFSPLFNCDPPSGRITDLINNALTNTPAMDDIDALVAASTLAEVPTMDPELKKALERAAELEKQNATLGDRIRALEGQTATVALSATVGLAATATQDDVRGKVVALAAFRKDVLTLAGKDSEAAAIGALSAMKEQSGEVLELRGRVEKAEAAQLQTEFDTTMADAVKAGKIPPAKEHPKHAFALGLASKGGKLTKDGVEAVKGYTATLDVLVPGDGRGTTAPGQIGPASTSQGIALSRKMGIDELAFQKWRGEQLAAAAAGGGVPSARS